MSSQHLEKLKQLMPPVNPPPENNVDWAMAEDVFGLRYPQDFKDFIHSYGNVIWCDLFRPIYPETSTRKQCEASRGEALETLSIIFNGDMCDPDGRVLSLKPYPAQGGLLPCLTDTNGSFICWLTAGDPDSWTLSQWHNGTVRELDCNFTQLISDWISQTPPFNDVWGPFFLTATKYGIAK
jgi:hypothetical protein